MRISAGDCLPWPLLQLLVSVHLVRSCSGVSPIEVFGYKFFDTETGDEFVVRGVAYEPRPNRGSFSQTLVDYFTEEHRHIWERDLVFLQALGVNAIRLHHVDPTRNHDAFMCQMNAAGIYVLVPLASDCPTCAVTRDAAPECYPPTLKSRGQAVINAFAKYPNVLGFSAGNEVNHFAPNDQPEWNGPCHRKFLRDMRAYIASCPNMRKVPVGLVSPDSHWDAVSRYYNCENNPDDPFEYAEWFGLHSYLSCDENIKDERGLTDLVDSLENNNYSIPVMLTEFGCLSQTSPAIAGDEEPRPLQQARWLLENSKSRDQLAGGFVFEYSTQLQNDIANSKIGIGYFSPENCDDARIPCKYNPEPSFYSLKDVYQSSHNNGEQLNLKDFTIPQHRQGRSRCPPNFTTLNEFSWNADRVNNLHCPPKGQESHFVCPSNLEDLRAALPEPTQSVLATLLQAMVFLTVASVVYSILMNQVKHMSRNVERHRAKNDPPTWTIVIPCVSRGNESDSASDESAGLLSMKQYSLYHSASIDSDLSEGSEEGDE